LLSKTPYRFLKLNEVIEEDPEVESVEYDSRLVGENSLFCAVQGAVTDGHLYLSEVLDRGAVAVASERLAPDLFPAHWVQVRQIRTYMAVLANEFYGHPSRSMRLIGITGTNGKTTTAFLVHSILKQAGASLLAGTIQTQIGQERFKSLRTTPEAIDIQKLLAGAIARGCRTGVMEVSSHALEFNRVFECHFPVAVFTNLSRDHLDFHKTMDHYFESKSQLFHPRNNPGIQHAVVNGDDTFCQKLAVGDTVAKTCFGLSDSNDVYPLVSEMSGAGTRLELSFLGRVLKLQSSMVGQHNIYNMMAAATACSRLGIPDDQIADGLESLTLVPGRFERVEVSAPFDVFIDYAHTPDGLKNVLTLGRTVTNNRVLCVFGCGGNRDREKRPMMGKIAVENADYVVVTSDNPRSESRQTIVSEIQAGIPKRQSNYEVEVDRERAIAKILSLAREHDLVILAGKGHENYQEVQGEKVPFDEREIVRRLCC
jgi:UDP-N-acetylmuramoyl-L-alanyl-D-glutamate--2,6-diaminopimelate ligase